MFNHTIGYTGVYKSLSELLLVTVESFLVSGVAIAPRNNRMDVRVDEYEWKIIITKMHS